MRHYSFRYIIYFLILLGLYSCSATKYVPDGDYLLDKVKIKSDVPGNKTLELKPYIKQHPNFKMLGLNKTMFQIYNLSGKDSTSWINKFLKKVGEEPVIFKPELVGKSENELRKLLVNKGYVDVEVTSDIIYRGKKADVIYSVTGNTPYRIGKYSYEFRDPNINAFELNEINGLPKEIVYGEQASLRNSLIKENNLFDRNILDAERDRITTLLHNRGYYAFDKNSISYEADTISTPYIVDMKLILKPDEEELPRGGVVEKPHRKYHFGKVDIYLDYDPIVYTYIEDYPKTDSIAIDNYTIFYQGKYPSLRPSLLLDNCFINPGKPYSLLNENITYSSLSTLAALNNVHIQYQEKDSAELVTTITTTPSKKQTVSFSVEGTNTSGDLGVAVSVNYTHRNLFRRSELFNLRVRGAYEALTNSNSNIIKPYLELGADASLSFPKFIFPFLSKGFLRQMRTMTEFSLSYNNQTRPEYDRTLLSGGVSYSWHERHRSTSRHKFDLLDIDYVYVPRIDSVFMSKMPSNAQFFGFTNQFIVGMSYAYHKSTAYPVLQKRVSASSVRFSIESAGNLLYGLSDLLNRPKDSQGSYQLLGTHFAQFVKADFDYSRTIIIDKSNSLAFRIGGGVGFPYLNSKWLPFEKRYYSGGANSVRAWSVRELGPGSYIPNPSTTFFNQSGDIKLDMNVEYRSKLFWKLEMAAFVDAGNIWTIKDYEGQEGGLFKLNSFYKEIALGYGLGLRLDFDFFLIRFDCGWKAYNPAKKGRDAWTILHPNFGDNWAWHIAVGYPF